MGNQNVELKTFFQKGEVTLSCRYKRMLNIWKKKLWIFDTTTTIEPSTTKRMLSETVKHIQYNNNSFNQLLLISNKKNPSFLNRLTFQHFLVLVQIQMLVLY